MKTQIETIQETEESFVEIRMTMTLNQTIGRGNDISYEIMERGPLARSYGARIDIRQVYGTRPEEARVLQESPENCYGLFKIQKYDYQSGKSTRVVGLSFTSQSAEKLAYRKSLKIAEKMARKRGLEVISTVEEDKLNLRKDLANLREEISRMK